MAASNRAGATSDEIMVRPVIFGSMASFITSGMEAAGGLWVGQLVIAFVPGLVIILVAVIKGNVTPAPFIVSGGLAPVLAFGFAALFNFTAGYWLAASLTILLVLAVVTWVQLEKGIAPRVKPFHHPSSQTPALALVKTVAQGRPAATRGDCPAPVTPNLSRAAAKHTTVAKRKCTTGVMGDGSDLGVNGGTGTVGRGPWEDYGPACSGADDAEAFSRLPLRR